jgi:hypothetical protein
LIAHRTPFSVSCPKMGAKFAGGGEGGQGRLIDLNLRFWCLDYFAFCLLFKPFLGSLINIRSPLNFKFDREKFELFQYSLSIGAKFYFFCMLHEFQNQDKCYKFMIVDKAVLAA